MVSNAVKFVVKPIKIVKIKKPKQITNKVRPIIGHPYRVNPIAPFPEWDTKDDS